MSYCPKCARLGLRRRIKRKNRIRINGVWCHKKCPDLTSEEFEHAKSAILEDKDFVFGDPKAKVNHKIVGIVDSKA